MQATVDLFCNLYKVHIGQQFRSTVVVVFVFNIPPTAKVIVICPSGIETRGSFAIILDGKSSLIDWLAFYLMRRLGIIFVALFNRIRGSGWGTVFCCFQRLLQDS